MSHFTGLLLIGAGGFFGAIARVGFAAVIDRFRGDHPFPLGIFAANILGCFLIGIIGGLIATHRSLPVGAERLLIPGFLGSFTTFSTFGFNTFDLARHDQTGWAVANVAASIALGLLAVWAGFALASLTRPA